MSFEGPVQTIGTLALLLACGFALWRGGSTERLAAVLIFIGWCATPIVQNHDNFRHPQIAMFALDGTVAGALLIIALATDRFWPLWVVSFQLLELLMHVAMLIDHRVGPRAYWIGMEIGSYLMLIALAVGTWLEAPRRPNLTSPNTVMS